MTKNIKIALIVFLFLLGIFLINNNSQGKLNSTSIPIFSENPQKITKVLIQTGSDAIELSKTNTMWKISGNDTLEIISRSIDNLFNKVLSVNRGTIISQNPKKYQNI